MRAKTFGTDKDKEPSFEANAVTSTPINRRRPSKCNELRKVVIRHQAFIVSMSLKGIEARSEYLDVLTFRCQQKFHPPSSLAVLLKSKYRS